MIAAFLEDPLQDQPHVQPPMISRKINRDRFPIDAPAKEGTTQNLIARK
jgi:hypothetical protein